MKRACGMLLPVASLPSEYGIGAFSKEAYAFVDQLAEAGQRYWQILPLGPTGYGDSPYQSFSAFAGNPYFIDLEELIARGLLTKAECDAADLGTDPQDIDYEKQYFHRFPLLKRAFGRWREQQKKKGRSDKKLMEFFADALTADTREYCFFMAVKNHFDGKSFLLWDEDIRTRRPEAVKAYRESCREEILFYEFLQYEFQEQWAKLKHYANGRGIRIIGDIPIYVAMDSADTWAHPELFQLDEENVPVAVAGCPPDGFSATGQLWGNPLYRWGYHKETGYQWWISRLAYVFRLYDVVRIDHFRGFDEYFSIPYGAETAVDGHWEKGPGMDLFNTVKEKLGDVDVIAEDLGYLTESVIEMVKESGYPGMKVLQFAFDSREESDYLPHNYERNCVVYTGTHDNDTILGWYYVMSEEDREFSKEYMGNAKSTDEELPWDFIRMSMESVANLAVTPMQEFLGLGTEARINYPSTLGNNWKWRLLPGQFTSEMAKRIHRLTQITARIAK